MNVRRIFRAQPDNGRPGAPRARLQIEVLESRALPAPLLAHPPVVLRQPGIVQRAPVTGSTPAAAAVTQIRPTAPLAVSGSGRVFAPPLNSQDGQDAKLTKVANAGSLLDRLGIGTAPLAGRGQGGTADGDGLQAAALKDWLYSVQGAMRQAGQGAAPDFVLPSEQIAAGSPTASAYDRAQQGLGHLRAAGEAAGIAPSVLDQLFGRSASSPPPAGNQRGSLLDGIFAPESVIRSDLSPEAGNRSKIAGADQSPQAGGEEGGAEEGGAEATTEEPPSGSATMDALDSAWDSFSSSRIGVAILSMLNAVLPGVAAEAGNIGVSTNSKDSATNTANGILGAAWSGATGTSNQHAADQLRQIDSAAAADNRRQLNGNKERPAENEQDRPTTTPAQLRAGATAMVQRVTTPSPVGGGNTHDAGKLLGLIETAATSKVNPAPDKEVPARGGEHPAAAGRAKVGGSLTNPVNPDAGSGGIRPVRPGSDGSPPIGPARGPR